MSGGKCESCLGEGQQLLLNSAFIGDGYRREKCGICDGTGHSRWPAASGQAYWQKQARVRDAAIRAYRKLHPNADYIALGRVGMDAA